MAAQTLFRIVELQRLSLSRVAKVHGIWHPSLTLARSAASALPRSPATLRAYIQDSRGRVVEPLAD